MILGAVLSTLYTQSKHDGIRAFLSPPELKIQQIFKDERFPNVIVTPTGTVLASWGRPNIRVRRSEDGGESWSDEIVISKSGFHGGGTTVNEVNGEIFIFVDLVTEVRSGYLSREFLLTIISFKVTYK